jgi:molybdenum cofactor guanylyltransferase
MVARRGLAPGGSCADRTRTMQPPADRDGRHVVPDGVPDDPTMRDMSDAVAGNRSSGNRSSGNRSSGNRSSGNRVPDSQNSDGSAQVRARATGLGALVLCGGASTRFGSDKALATVGGTTLLERTLDVLAQRTNDLVVATGHEARYADVLARFEGLRLALDRAPGLGPLAGLEAGLACFDPGAEVLVVACDLPNLDLESIDALVAERRRDDLDLCLWHDLSGPHPLLGCYRASVLPAVTAALDRGERRLISFHGSTAVTTRRSADAPPGPVGHVGRDEVPQGLPGDGQEVDGACHAVQSLRVGYLSPAEDRDRSDPAANANSRSELRRILGSNPTSEETPTAPRRPSTP